MVKASDEEAWYHLYRSGVVDNNGSHVVPIALSKATQTAHLVWETISPRLAHARLKGINLNITAVLIHAPTLDAEEEAKKRILY